jgi:hypothetical protein
MNRRNFINNILTAAAGFAILPSAMTYKRTWTKSDAGLWKLTGTVTCRTSCSDGNLQILRANYEWTEHRLGLIIHWHDLTTTPNATQEMEPITKQHTSEQLAAMSGAPVSRKGGGIFYE